MNDPLFLAEAATGLCPLADVAPMRANRWLRAHQRSERLAPRECARPQPNVAASSARAWRTHPETSHSERVPGRGRCELEIAHIGAEPQPEGDQFCSKFALCSVARQPCGRWRRPRRSGPRWLPDCQITGLVPAATSEQTRAPTASMASALGYDRLRILADRIFADRIFADRIFADRIFADRGCRHRGRLPTGQVSGGRNAQHGK
jgi:hypothetical protein